MRVYSEDVPTSSLADLDGILDGVGNSEHNRGLRRWMSNGVAEVKE
jgi:hypothetical protein